MIRCKHILMLWLLSFVLSPIKAQTSVFSVGVRGGGETYLLSAVSGAMGEFKPSIGLTGTLDVRYIYYHSLNNRFEIGVALGAGVGYGTSGLKGTHTDRYSNTDYLGNQIDYNVNAAFSQTDRFAKAEASLLLALRYSGVTLQVGPRFMAPFASSSSAAVESANIDAYYPQYDVHVVNKDITGNITTPYSLATTPSLPKYDVLMAMELGYEWSLTNKSSLGVQLYADVSVWGQQSTSSSSVAPLIQVMPITDASMPVPAVNVNTPADEIAYRRYIDFGLRLYYAFSSSRKSHRAHARDTRLHHNRHL